MLRDIKEHKEVIMSIQKERDDPPGQPEEEQPAKRMKLASADLPFIDETDFDAMRALCKILGPLEAATKKFSEEKSTASIVIPTIIALQTHTQQQIGNFYVFHVKNI